MREGGGEGRGEGSRQTFRPEKGRQGVKVVLKWQIICTRSYLELATFCMLGPFQQAISSPEFKGRANLFKRTMSRDEILLLFFISQPHTGLGRGFYTKKLFLI